jgi:hypothetical protein
MEVVVVKQRHNLEAVWAGAKKGGSKVEITSLNSHFRLLGPRHKILGGNSPGRDSTYLAKMLSLREVHIWYGDLKYWGVHATKHT